MAPLAAARVWQTGNLSDCLSGKMKDSIRGDEACDQEEKAQEIVGETTEL